MVSKRFAMNYTKNFLLKFYHSIKSITVFARTKGGGRGLYYSRCFIYASIAIISILAI